MSNSSNFDCKSYLDAEILKQLRRELNGDVLFNEFNHKVILIRLSSGHYPIFLEKVGIRRSNENYATKSYRKCRTNKIEKRIKSSSS